MKKIDLGLPLLLRGIEVQAYRSGRRGELRGILGDMP
jgi:hypothetical protein